MSETIQSLKTKNASLSRLLKNFIKCYEDNNTYRKNHELWEKNLHKCIQDAYSQETLWKKANIT